MTINKILLSALAALSLSSCGLYKNYERPAQISAEGIYGASQSGDRSMAELRWRDIFTDPALQDLIERGLRNNSNIRQADLRVLQAQNSLKAARLAYLPAIGFNPSGTLSGGVDPYDRAQYKNQLGSGMAKTYDFPIALSWQIDCFGSIRNAKKKSQVAVENMQYVRQAVQTALVANIASMYYALCMMDSQLAISEQTCATWKKNLEVTRMLMEAGQSNKAAVASTEANYWNILASVEDLKLSIKDMEHNLSTLLGETPAPIARGTLSSFHTPAICTTGLPISILQHRPDVKQAEMALASAFYTKNMAKAAFFPALNISAQGQYTNSITGLGIVNPGGIIMAAVASITQPIFAQGKLRANYKNSKAEIEVATIGFQQALLNAGNEVARAINAVNAASEKREYLGKQVAALTQAVDATEKLMKLSNTNYLQVLTAQSGLLQAQLGEVSNQYKLVSSTINLYQSLGGGAE